LSFTTGTSDTSACTVTSINGFTGGVTFSCANVPNGITCGPSPGGATLSSGQSTGTKVTVGGKPPAGKYQLDAVVKSDDGSIVRSVTLTVTVS
jgi:hypothetical protein